MPIRHGDILANRASTPATRPLLPRHNRAASIQAHDVKRVLADIIFEHMPELKWAYGYYLVIGVIVAICTTLYIQFRRNGWL
jgi:hypothetical protein